MQLEKKCFDEEKEIVLWFYSWCIRLSDGQASVASISLLIKWKNEQRQCFSKWILLLFDLLFIFNFYCSRSRSLETLLFIDSDTATVYQKQIDVINKVNEIKSRRKKYWQINEISWSEITLFIIFLCGKLKHRLFVVYRFAVCVRDES